MSLYVHFEKKNNNISKGRYVLGICSPNFGQVEKCRGWKTFPLQSETLVKNVSMKTFPLYIMRMIKSCFFSPSHLKKFHPITESFT